MIEIIKQLKTAMKENSVTKYRIRKDVKLSHRQMENILNESSNSTARNFINACRAAGIKQLKL